MRLFDRNAPGVEWTGEDAHTEPNPPPPLRLDAYPAACPACGGELGVDGYCLQCGQKAQTTREHFETTPVPWVAGVCDIGRAHPRNEDAMACQATADRAVIVVCDGVTTSDDSDLAAMAAARAACDAAWGDNPAGLGTPESRQAAMTAALTRAVAAANEAVGRTGDPDSANSAATTIAVAVIGPADVYCANLGDSRIYWLPDDGVPTQTTKDHSLAQDGIDSGTGRAEAESSVFAHTITKWLGRDAVDVVPAVSALPRTVAGWLVVCTDGLWNYASEATAVQDLVRGLVAEDPAPPHVAAGLVAWANAQGGHDNVTVVCARLDAPGSTPSPTDSPPVGEDSAERATEPV